MVAALREELPATDDFLNGQTVLMYTIASSGYRLSHTGSQGNTEWCLCGPREFDALRSSLSQNGQQIRRRVQCSDVAGQDQVRPNFMIEDSSDASVGAGNQLIRGCLQPEPYLRPTFFNILQRLRYINLDGELIGGMAAPLEKYANDIEELVQTRRMHLQARTAELEEERPRTDNLLQGLEKSKNQAETLMNAVIGMSRILLESDLSPDDGLRRNNRIKWQSAHGGH
ncbi:MAG: hypothetical protein J3Q66DRAFT_410611 [Benniella sp.]|nr:MAG: hypothetical protein J3Q66DRAFT_410611 [Benniella sp.]